jgi:hypothetical protein
MEAEAGNQPAAVSVSSATGRRVPARGQGGAAGADPLSQRDLLCCVTMSVDFRQVVSQSARRRLLGMR